MQGELQKQHTQQCFAEPSKCFWMPSARSLYLSLGTNLGGGWAEAVAATGQRGWGSSRSCSAWQQTRCQVEQDRETGTRNWTRGGTFDHSTFTGKVHLQKSAHATCRGGFAWHADSVLSHQASTQLNFNINRD